MLRPLISALHRRALSLRAAVDLVSIMVGVIIVGIISAVLLSSVFVVIPWAQVEAGKQTIKAVADAEKISRTLPIGTASSGRYRTVSALASNDLLSGETTARAAVNAAGDCYIAAGAINGDVWFMDSTMANPKKWDGVAANPSACPDVDFPALVNSLPGGPSNPTGGGGSVVNKYADQCLDGSNRWELKDPTLQAMFDTSWGNGPGHEVNLSDLEKRIGSLTIPAGTTSLEGLQCLHTNAVSLNVDGTLVSDLTPLKNTKIGYLTIRNNPNLINLNGLQGHKTAFTSEISNNANLTSLDGFSDCFPTGQTNMFVNVHDNPNLTDVSGFTRNNSIANLTIQNNPKLANIAISDISYLSYMNLTGNPLLTTLTLNNVQGISSWSGGASPLKEVTYNNVSTSTTDTFYEPSGPTVEKIHYKNLKVTAGLSITGKAALQSIDLDGAPSVTLIVTQGNPNLTSGGVVKNTPNLATRVFGGNAALTDLGTYDASSTITYIALGNDRPTPAWGWLSKFPNLSSIEIAGAPDLSALSSFPASFVRPVTLYVHAPEITQPQADAFTVAHPNVTVNRLPS